MKGIELPVNVLVIIAVAVLVMLALVAMYMAGTQGAGPMAALAAKNTACGQLLNQQCDVNPNTLSVNYDANANGQIKFVNDASGDNLQVLCNKNFGCESKGAWGSAEQIKCCKQACGCSNIG